MVDRRQLIEWIEGMGGSVTFRDLTHGLRAYRGDTAGAEKSLDGAASLPPRAALTPDLLGRMRCQKHALLAFLRIAHEEPRHPEVLKIELCPRASYMAPSPTNLSACVVYARRRRGRGPGVPRGWLLHRHNVADACGELHPDRAQSCARRLAESNPRHSLVLAPIEEYIL